MYRTRQYHIRKGHKMFSYCADICRKSTYLYNRANYILRQYATAVRDFENLKPLTANQMEVYKSIKSVTESTKYEPKGKWLTYGTLDFYMKQTRDINYYDMYSQASQQILKLLLRNYKAFFNSLKVYKANTDMFTGRPKMPGYKTDGSYTTAILTNQICKIADGRYLKVPGYKYRLNLGNLDEGTSLKEVRIKHSADVFIIDVVLETEERAIMYKAYPELSDEQLTRQQLMELVETARLTPSAANRQPFKYRIVCDEEENEKVFRLLGFAGYLKDWDGPSEGEKPTGYIVITCPANVNDEVDAGIVGQTMLLAATEAGFGGCFFGNVKRDELKTQLNIPSELKIVYVIAFGYPKEEVVLEDIPADGDIKYYRDENQVHHVPKKRIEDIVL